jgi:ATP-dependent exoDNAse (exonuclease V) beta subunit
VLVTTNQQAEDLAVALSKLNINAALARPGLLATPEGRMLHAALRMLASDRDDAAAACLDALFEFDGLEPDVWLAAQLNYGAAVRAYRAEVNAQKTYPQRPAGKWRMKLQALAERVDWASPVELVDGVIEAFDLGSLAARWPHPAQRLGNLEALRALTLEYETDCRHYDQAATLSGLIAHLESAQDPTWDGEEMRASDAQFYSPTADAVVLCTYHRAKGLEWPVVVLASLGSAPKKDVFSLHVESDNDAFDPTAPLAGRWLRYWPWPFGAQKKAPLRDQAEQSTFGVEVARAERSERTRLLYVGFTRARDHLVLAARSGKHGPVTLWLDELTGAGDEALLKLPAAPPDSASEQHAPVTVRADACGEEVHTRSRVWKLGVETLPLAATMPKPRCFTLESTSPASRLPYWMTPSNAVRDWPEVGDLQLVRTERLHPSIRVSADFSHTWEELGDAVHAFFAIDVAGHTESARLDLARRCLAALRLDYTALPADLLHASDELQVWVARRFPDATWRREVPVGALVGEAGASRRINGSIDLLLETSDGYAIIDHKSFPNPRREALESRARDHFPQLSAYGRCLEVLGTKPVLGYFLHFGLAGAIVEAARVR